jgi:hypothetical protein
LFQTTWVNKWSCSCKIQVAFRNHAPVVLPCFPQKRRSLSHHDNNWSEYI